MKKLIEHIVESYKTNILLETRGVGIQSWEQGIKGLYFILYQHIVNHLRITSDDSMLQKMKSIGEMEWNKSELNVLINLWFKTNNIDYFPGLDNFIVNVIFHKRLFKLNCNGYMSSRDDTEEYYPYICLDIDYNSNGDINKIKLLRILFHEFKHIYDELMIMKQDKLNRAFSKNSSYDNLPKIFLNTSIDSLLHFLSPIEINARMSELYYIITPQFINQNRDKITNIQSLVQCTTMFQSLIKLSENSDKIIDKLNGKQCRLLMDYFNKPGERNPNGRGLYNKDFVTPIAMKNYLKKKVKETINLFYKRMVRTVGDKIQDLGDKYNWIR